MKILFAGTPEIAVPSLQALAAEFSLVGVLTAPDKVSGRGRRQTPPPVKTAAVELGLTVLQPSGLGSDARRETEKLGADLLVVFAYGRIFGPRFLSLFPKGGINMHPSALPLYRGPSPLTAAILDGVDRTALTVQRVALEMDAGDILRQSPIDLDGTETTGSLTDTVAQAAPSELAAAVRDIESGTVRARPQDHDKATYCRLTEKADGEIDWKRPAVVIERMVRAYQPWPKARTSLNGEGLVILGSETADEASADSIEPGTVVGVDKSRGILIQTGEGLLALTRLQLASRKPLDFRSFLNGAELEIGMKLGDA
jgi:methionyl-tRNA formyltransferase